MGVYGLPWTPTISFLRIQTQGAEVWVQGAFGTKLKNLHFCHKTPHYGCLWTRLDPSNQFSGDSDPWGQILGPRGFWTQIQKSALTPQYGCLWTRLVPSNQFSGDLDPWGQILGPRGFWTLIQKSALTPQCRCLWTRLDPSNQILGNSDPWGQILGPSTYWHQIKKSVVLS